MPTPAIRGAAALIGRMVDSMSERVNISQAASRTYKAMVALNGAVTLEHRLFEFVKMRASVLNGCAFCVDMHGSQLIEDGEPMRRIMALSAYRESTMFTPRERAALAMTDAITNISVAGVPDDVYAEARKHFDDEELAQLVMAIVVINSWNRIAITSETPTPPLEG